MNIQTCLILGETTLPLPCAEILLRQHYTISAIVTSEISFIEWAKEHAIPCFQPGLELAALLREHPVDYLFSIANLTILSPEVLKLPRKLAINYHDGPLPRYAGLNVPSWAILNHEAQHGITWHIMTPDVDAGAILQQEVFPIEPDDTVLLLNTKGYEAAIRAFDRLVTNLNENHLQPQPQSAAPEYFLGSKRPSAACTLLWHRPAEELSVLVRALTFGAAYSNPLGFPKLLLNGDALLVNDLEILPMASNQAPGTITRLQADSLRIATTTHDVALHALQTTDGQRVSIGDLSELYNLSEGDRLPTFDPPSVERLTTLHEALAKYEKAWVKRLAALQPIDVPCAQRKPAQEQHTVYKRKSIPLPEVAPARNTDWLLAAFAAYLARIEDRIAFDVNFSDPSIKFAVKGFEPFFTAQVPLRLYVESDQTFDQLLAAVREQLQWVRKRQSFTRDIFLRYPELHKVPQILPISVQYVDCFDDFAPESSFTMLVSKDGACQWVYDPQAIDEDRLNSMQQQFTSLLRALLSDSSRSIREISLVTAEYWQTIQRWNNTASDYPRDQVLHRLIEAQVEKTPDAVAVVARDGQLTYRQLNARANQLAHYLKAMGVEPETLVGICSERTTDMLVGLLAILKAGAAYLPLDPTYPKERLGFMIEDAHIRFMLTHEHLIERLPLHSAQMICLDSDWSEISKQSCDTLDGGATADNLAYVIYTSGSTGKPKGVMLTHRNVVNFVYAMDQHIEHDPAGVWLAVTSISFDISILELFWTLGRGFKIVLYTGDSRKAHRVTVPDFSLFYFASDESEGSADKYRLLLEGAKFADTHGFSAVWTPERHFHAFGGLYPNPSVAGAAIAAITQHVQIRAGSCVLPLHDPIRVAEEWSVVDNISNGRVGLSFASGWQPNDFVLMPQNFADRKDLMFRQIETVQRLWRGESLPFPSPTGQTVNVHILPRPVQSDLPIWVTAAGNPETFKMAGERGFGLLTHLLGQTVEELAQKIAIYRRAWHEHGHTGKGHITLMVHTFVGASNDSVRETVREPMKAYLRSSVGLIQQAAWSFPTFKQTTTGADGKFSLDHLSEDEMNAVLDFAFERYFETGGLFGTPETCLNMVDTLAEVGVNEIACLIDFGVASEVVLEHLEALNIVRQRAKSAAESDGSVAGLLRQHQVTHMQCTPSMASMLMLDNETREALQPLKQLLVGGEALPLPLAAKLKQTVSGEVRNMYGPTETTIWSSTCVVDTERVSIGRPIANTQFLILDRNHQPVPIGVTGELFIGGDGVARGYLNRPELTSERFIDHPFIHKTDARLYRTGDLVRYFPDGSVEFLGRVDHQVKIRGYRIEPGEIEAAISTNPAVRETVVVARPSASGDMTLTAYLALTDGASLSSDDLRAHLKHILPDHMLPARFEVVAALPRTLNGKINRDALDQLGQTRLVPTRSFVAPRDELERKLADIWEKALGVQPMSVRDNFFDMGGHSLLAVRVFAQVEQSLGKRLPLATFFQAPTIEQIANIFRDQSWSARWTALVPIQPTGSRPPFFCVHAHGGHVMFYHRLAHHLGADQPFYALQAQGLDGARAPYIHFEEMAAHYLQEIRSVQPNGPYFLGGDCMGGVIAYEMAQQLQAQGQEVALIAVIDSLSPGYVNDTSLLYNLAHNSNKIAYYHLPNLRRLTTKERISYIAEKSDRFLFTTKMRFKKLLHQLHLTDEKLAPLAVVQDALQNALDSYQPKPYNGQITLFRASRLPAAVDHDPQFGWGRFALDGVEVHEIPAYFTTAIFEPSVQVLAAKLLSSIEEKSKSDQDTPKKSA